MSRRRLLDQAGDTIVEVLIAVVVVGLGIGLGYAVASRSLKANRQAQERVEAVKQVEAQIERLKKASATDTTGSAGSIFALTNPFCLVSDGSNSNKAVNINPPASINDDPINQQTYTGSGGSCISSNGLYHFAIRPVTLSGGQKQFNVTARWYGLGSVSKEEVLISYRIYPSEQ